MYAIMNAVKSKFFKNRLDFCLCTPYNLIVPQRKEVENVGIHKGTKLTNNPKITTVKARIDKKTLEKLDCLVSEQNSSRSEIIRRGIDIQYERRK